jgi:polar amino acid transport system substrate-binding protein
MRVTRSIRGAVLAAVSAALAMVVGAADLRAQGALQEILKTKKIVVGIHNGKPWGYKGEDGKVSGFSPDLVRAAFAPMGVDQIDFIVSDFGALIPGLVARRVDIVASGLYITPARCSMVAFSDPDLSLKDAILVKKGNPSKIHSYEDIAKNTQLKLGIPRGSANAVNAVDAGVPSGQTLLLQDGDTTLGALLAGRVDAASFSAPSAIAILADPNVTAIERATPFKGFVGKNGLERAGYSAIGFRPADGDLRDAYNKRLAEMKADGTVAAIMAKYGFTEAETAPALSQDAICKGNG